MPIRVLLSWQLELDERSEALRKCGVEIMELRKLTKQQNADKSALHKALSEKEALHDQATAADEGLELLDRGDLEKRCVGVSICLRMRWRERDTKCVIKIM